MRPLLTPSALALSALALLGVTACASSPKPAEPGGDTIKVNHKAERKIFSGTPDKFTGEVTVDMLFTPTSHRRASGATVRFSPGARTAWHSHPSGQTLVVTEGQGWVQQRGGERVEMKPGDVIWTPPGVEHWHGASADAAIAHIALQDQVGGKVVEWGDHVTDAQYQGEQAAQ